MITKQAWLSCMCWALVMTSALAEDAPAPPLDKPGWKLTFHDEFDRPQLDDMYWYSAYRSGRKEYFKRIGHKSRWVDHNAHYVIEDGILKLRVDENLPFRPDKSTPCVSCIQTSGWIGQIDPNMTYPKDFEIDYVRVYASDTE